MEGKSAEPLTASKPAVAAGNGHHVVERASGPAPPPPGVAGADASRPRTNEADTAGLLANAEHATGEARRIGSEAELPTNGKQDHVAVELLKWTMNMTVAFGASYTGGTLSSRL